MHTTRRFDDDHGQRGYLSLAMLVVGLILGAMVLYGLAGPPHLPAEIPSWDVIMVTLRGSSVPYEALAYLFTTAAWIVWFWMVGSLALRFLVVSADALTQGASWVRPLRAVSDLITLPVIRETVGASP